jgi:SAM-dependent methyltransferase
MKNQTLFDKYLQGKHWAGHPTVYAEKFSDFLKGKGFEGKLVDVGCGSGRDVDYFRLRGFNVFGIDYDEKEVATAKSDFPESNFMTANAEEMPFADTAIGAFFMINVMHYVDQTKVMEEISRTLAPGGYAFIHFNLRITDAEGVTDYVQDKESIEKLFEGFSVVQESTLHRVDQTPFLHEHEILEVILRR